MKAVMVMYDSLNRHMLPNYGCDWTLAPNFVGLGERAVTFDNHYVGSMPCMPARRELHTGRHNFLHRSWGPFEPFDDSTFTILKENGVYTHLVPCPASFWCFRVRHARQCKAWSAGNIGHIGKDHNAAVSRMANSRRARPTGPVAVLRPLAMGPPFPAGTRLATDPVGRAEIPETCGTRHWSPTTITTGRMAAPPITTAIRAG